VGKLEARMYLHRRLRGALGAALTWGLAFAPISASRPFAAWLSLLGFVFSLLACIATACVRTAPVPALAYWVSSDSSQYSPVVHLRVAPMRSGATILVRFDSGAITVPGTLTASSPVMMHNLYLTAYVAVANRTPLGLVREDTAGGGDRRGWRAVAESDSVLIADRLRFGERLAIQFAPLEVNNVPSSTTSQWLVLRISGESVDLRIPFDTNGPLRAGAPGARRLRVYACSDRDLAGQLDSARSNGLRRAYGLSC
jgi:hypothetical protein